MEIKIIGKNSSNRMKLMKNIERASSNIEGKIDITLLEDEKSLNKYNVTNSPALVIDEKVVSQGKVLNEKEIKNYIKLLC